MGKYLEVYNNSGNIVIDDYIRNYHLLKKENLPVKPSMEITDRNGNKKNLARYNSDGTYTYVTYPWESGTVDENNILAIGCSANNMLMGYFFTREPEKPSAHGIGFQALNSDGNVVYDSNWKTMKPVWQGTAKAEDFSQEAGGKISYTLDNNKDYAVVISSICFGSGQWAGMSLGFFVGTFWVLNNVLANRGVIYSLNQLPPSGFDEQKNIRGTAHCMLLDVTGY